MIARDEYGARLGARRADLSARQRTHVTLGNLRLGGFLALVAMAIALFNSWAFSAWWLLVPVAALVVLGRVMEAVEAHIARLTRATLFYETGLARLDGRWAGKGDQGDRFRDDRHLYAADLDILGHASVFERVCLARTERGQETLAAWLLAPAAPDEIRSRQASARELIPRLDLREDLALAGLAARSSVHVSALVAWGEGLPLPVSQPLRMAAGVIGILGAAAFAAGCATLLAEFGFVALPPAQRGVLRAYALSIWGLCLLVNWWLNRRVDRFIEDVFRPEHGLALAAGLLARIESETFESPRLAALRRVLVSKGQTASARIARLHRLVDMLKLRRTEPMKLVGPFLLWNFHVACAIEDWRRASGAAIRGWLDAVGEIEAIASIAGYAYETPAAIFPELSTESPLFEAEGMTHPLLPADRAVANDVRLSADTRVFVVSGSNMSGKSTLLRTIGVNAVLAQAGAPVSATRFHFSPLSLGASIRVQDSLQEGTSRFYAEISRLSQIVKTAEGATPTLFLIDEFLHGTNSHDRQIGAEAVVRGLIERGAIGLITTHDLALTRIASTLAPRVTNVHFQDYLENGRMRFDYRLRPGIVEHSNALELMRSVGLDV